MQAEPSMTVLPSILHEEDAPFLPASLAASLPFLRRSARGLTAHGRNFLLLLRIHAREPALVNGLSAFLGDLRDFLPWTVGEVARVGVAGRRLRIHGRGATALASLASLLGDLRDFLLGAIGEVAGVGACGRRPMTGLSPLLGNLRDLLLGTIGEVARVGVAGGWLRIDTRGAAAVASLASFLGDLDDLVLGAVGKVAGVGISSRRHND